MTETREPLWKTFGFATEQAWLAWVDGRALPSAGAAKQTTEDQNPAGSPVALALRSHSAESENQPPEWERTAPMPTTATFRSIMEENEIAETDYPPVEVEGYLLHVFERGGSWAVWLNTEVSCFDGICLSYEATRDGAVREAVKILEAATAALQQPPSDNGAVQAQDAAKGGQV